MPAALLFRATVILLAGFALSAALGRASAAARHLLWTCLFAALLLLPALQWFGPTWRVSVPARAGRLASSVVTGVATSPAAPSEPQPPRFPYIAMWQAGIAFAALRMLLAYLRLLLLTRTARPASWAEPNTVPILESAALDLPIAFGALRPAIVFPAAAAAWSPERRRLVLAHEMAHVRRRDCLTQWIAEAARAVYWFHPLVWLALSRFRKERERACDDAVLRLGTKQSDYAGHLLAIVKSIQTKGSLPMSVSFHSRDFEARLQAILNPTANRRRITAKLAAAAAILAACIVVPLATMRAQPTDAAAAIAGSVSDPSGAAIPRAAINATGLDTHNKEAAYTGADGRYGFHSLPPGRYLIEVRAPGFAPYRRELTIAAASSLQLNPVLDIGSVVETVEIDGQRGNAATPTATPQRIRVGGNVQATKLTYKVAPVYPPRCEQNGISGAVVLQGVIGTQGTLLSLTTLSQSADPELVQAARDAVSQWRYQPTLLNGQPVEVVTTITVNFHLE